MTVDLTVPSVGESIQEVQIGDWLKQPGQHVNQDETVVVIETDKVTVELPAPESGILAEILVPSGESARVGDVIGRLEPKEGAAKRKAPKEAARKETVATAPPAAVRKSPPPPDGTGPPKAPHPPRVMPAAARVLAERGLSARDVEATGPGGRLLKEDVLRHGEATAEKAPLANDASPGRETQVVRLSPLRRSIARRLVEAQQTAALLTTFNEIDMTRVQELRAEHKDAYQKKFGIKLGFMSFFVKAAVDALKLVPQVNAQMQDDSVVFHNYADIGIAVGGGKGLVVPVLRNAEQMSFAEVELAIADFAERARDNKLTLEELSGGTFTISNGGVYGSLLSTPIINPPQSGILGLHAIQDRPVAISGEVKIRPMMYVALSYDHRIIDGREAVTFLRRIKTCMEDPARILLEV